MDINHICILQSPLHLHALQHHRPCTEGISTSIEGISPCRGSTSPSTESTSPCTEGISPWIALAQKASALGQRASALAQRASAIVAQHRGDWQLDLYRASVTHRRCSHLQSMLHKNALPYLSLFSSVALMAAASSSSVLTCNSNQCTSPVTAITYMTCNSRQRA